MGLRRGAGTMVQGAGKSSGHRGTQRGKLEK